MVFYRVLPVAVSDPLAGAGGVKTKSSRRRLVTRQKEARINSGAIYWMTTAKATPVMPTQRFNMSRAVTAEHPDNVLLRVT